MHGPTKSACASRSADGEDAGPGFQASDGIRWRVAVTSPKKAPSSDPDTEQTQAPLQGPGDRSPLLSVVRAGSGALVPLAPSFPARRVLAVTTKPTSDATSALPELLFLTSDAPVSPAAAIENALANPASAIFRITGWALIDNVLNVAPDLFLRQMTLMVAVAREALEYCQRDPHARDERIQARQHLEALEKWITLSTLDRSGGRTNKPLRVSQAVQERALALGRLGNKLRHSWSEYLLSPADEENTETRSARKGAKGAGTSPGCWDGWIHDAMEILDSVPGGLMVSELQREMKPHRFPANRKAKERLSSVLRGAEPWPDRGVLVALVRGRERRLLPVDGWRELLAEVIGTGVTVVNQESPPSSPF